jgi:hypothetical protein
VFSISGNIKVQFELTSTAAVSKEVSMSEEDWGQMLEEQEKQQQEQQLSSKVLIKTYTDIDSLGKLQ